MAGKNVTKGNKSTNNSTVVKIYLFSYNTLQVLGWAYLFFQTVNHFISTGNVLNSWDVVKSTVILFQNAAVLEIVNVALGLVKSSLLVTFLQVLSRVVVVCGVLVATPTAPNSIGLPMLLIAWSITEIIRYSYYALNLLHYVPSFLVWCRYTFFYALYPLGVTGELLCFYSAQSYVSESKQWTIELPNVINFTFSYRHILLIFMAAYIPLFPKLFLHMVGQRKKILGNQTVKKHS